MSRIPVFIDNTYYGAPTPIPSNETAACLMPDAEAQGFAYYQGQITVLESLISQSLLEKDRTIQEQYLKIAHLEVNNLQLILLLFLTDI